MKPHYLFNFFCVFQNLLEFLEKAEDKFAHMGPLGSDIDAVKKQIAQLKDFKDEVDPQMVKVEALNRSVLNNPITFHNKFFSDFKQNIKEESRLYF